MRKISWSSAGAVLIFGVFFLWTEQVSAKTQIIISKKHEQIYIHDGVECKKDDTCDLKKVIFRTRNRHMPPEYAGDLELLTMDAYASYETDEVKNLKKYAFVQFLRGCIYTESPSGETLMNVGRPHMDTPDGLALHYFLDWTTDSIDGDPLYGSNPNFLDERHYLYQWANISPLDIPEEQENLYGEVLPTKPELFVKDFAMPALFYPNGLARNVSMEYRMCLFKTDEVPIVAQGNETNFAKPIVCFDRIQSNVYDHQAGKWKSPQGVVAECRRPLSPQEVIWREILRVYYQAEERYRRSLERNPKDASN